MATSLAFNAQFYLSQNLDVAAAISRGQFASAEEHFNTYGRFEGRNPNQFFDVTYYLQANQDVAASLSNPLEHFLNFGAAEGRFANASIDAAIDTDNNNFANEFDAQAYLAANPDLANAVGAGRAFETAYQHFVLFGQFEGRPGTPAGGPFTNTGTAPGTGTTFTLTDGIDQFNGTALNDTFQGTTANLNAFDSINGGAGSNTLNLVGDLPGEAVTSAVSIQNIQTVNLTGNSSAVDASIFGTAAQQIWQVGQSTTISNLSEGQTAGFRNTSVQGVTVSYDDAATTASVALEGVRSSGFDFEGSPVTATSIVSIDGAGLDTIDVSGSLAGSGTQSLGIAVSNTTTDITTLNVSLSSDTNLQLRSAELFSIETFNASGSTGDITVNLSSTTQVSADNLALTTATFGSGNDFITVDLGVFEAETVTANLGAGNDILVINAATTPDTATALNVTLGAGQDLIQFNGLNNIVEAGRANFADSIISITDFNANQDTFAINDAGESFFNQNLVNSAVGGSGIQNLYDAVSAVDALLEGQSGGVYAQFVYGGDTYIFANNSTSATTGVDTGDGLVRLAGVTTLLNGDAVFFGNAAETFGA